MQNNAFSNDDIDFLASSELIIRKNQMVKSLFSELVNVRESIDNFLKKDPIHGIKIQEGKISKGENYHGLPYLVLDHPAHFKKDNILAMRTIVWWGNFYSFNFILKGKPLNRFKGNIMVNYKKFKDDYVYIGKSPWIHDIDKNYAEVKSLDDQVFQEQLLKNKFYKLARKHDLSEINDLSKNALKFYQKATKYFLI